MVKEIRNIHREVLPNGLTIITEQMQHIRSVSIGIWIKSGSRDEDAAMEWHLPLHRAYGFQGHEAPLGGGDCAAKWIPSAAGMDAFTAKECICFNVKVLDEHLPIAHGRAQRPGFESDFRSRGHWP